MSELGHTLSGKWRKDKPHCESMREACEAVQLNWILRQALGLLNTMEIEDTPDHLKITIKAGGIMDVVEQYPWSGEQRQHARRDKRAGHLRGGVTQTHKGPAIRVHWDEPYAGSSLDTFSLSQDGHTLSQQTDMLMSTGKLCSYRTLYKRL